MQRARDKLPLMAILLLALGWRLALWAQPLHLPANDELEYVRVAHDLLAGRGWTFYESWRWLRAPLYPLFLAGSLGLFRLNPGLSTAEALHLAALPNLLLSVGLVYLIYRLTRELAPDSGEGPALLAAAAAALLQTYATFASLYMSETLFSVLFAGGLLELAAWRRRGGLWRAGLAGGLLGLACLTRSAALVFLPLAGLWMVWVAARGSEGPGRAAQGPGFWRQILAPPALMGAATALVIAPWTLRNCLAYEECILIETGGAYNLWAFYDPHESIDAINQALEAIPSPVARADQATRRGLARLREDPTIVLRKIPEEWTRLWGVKPIQDRFLLTSAYSDPPPVLFLSALVLDDLLYLLVLCGAPFGLALTLTRRDAVGALLGLWVAVFVAATLVTHGEGRYRHFLFMALIPLAAAAWDGLLRGERLRRRAALAAGAPLALALLPLLVLYPWGWAADGAARSVWRAVGDTLAWAARPGAADAYLRAIEADETPDGWIALGNLRRREGEHAEALEVYALAHQAARTYVGPSAVWGDLLRELGREGEARAAFRGRYLDQQRLSDWSYQMLQPVAPGAVDVGGGLDIGYVGGVFLPEEQQGATARWSDGRGRLRLGTAGATGLLLVTLRVAAPRPEGGVVPLSICGGGQCVTVALGPAWQTVRVVLPTGAGVLELRSATFLAPDGRDLGVMVDWARVERAGVVGD